jgi:hypothetical protein
VAIALRADLMRMGKSGVRFCTRLNLFTGLSLQFCNSYSTVRFLFRTEAQVAKFASNYREDLRKWIDGHQALKFDEVRLTYIFTSELSTNILIKLY